MPSNTTTTIKDKLPEGYYGILSKPLFYCDLDDTLHLSRSDASYHWHKCKIDEIWRDLCNTQNVVQEKAKKIQEMKTRILPDLQRSLNSLNALIKNLVTEKDWASSFTTHAAKRREILKHRFNRMTLVAVLHEKIIEFSHLKREYREARERIETLKKQRDEAKRKAKEAEEYWKDRKEEDKV